MKEKKFTQMHGTQSRKRETCDATHPHNKLHHFTLGTDSPYFFSYSDAFHFVWDYSQLNKLAECVCFILGHFLLSSPHSRQELAFPFPFRSECRLVAPKKELFCK